jgi:hypothetical protein
MADGSSLGRLGHRWRRPALAREQTGKLWDRRQLVGGCRPLRVAKARQRLGRAGKGRAAPHSR